MGCLTSLIAMIFGIIGSVLGIVFGIVGSVIGGVGIIVGVIVPIVVLIVPALIFVGILWFIVQVFKKPDEEQNQSHTSRPHTPPQSQDPVDGDVVDVEDFKEIKDEDPHQSDEDKKR